MPPLKPLDADLIAIAKQDATPADESYEHLSYVQQFAIDNNVVPSDKLTEARKIFWLYLKWCWDKKRLPTVKSWFFRDFSKHYEHVKNNGTRYYKIDPAPFEMDEEEWWDMQNYFRNLRETPPK